FCTFAHQFYYYLKLFSIIAGLFLAFQLSSQTFVGTATIYSKKFDGRKTYSGQLFSSKKVSAAHPWLPMGTKVEVTNLKNKKKLIVTINDRMGKSSGYLLDMSAAAAKKIGLHYGHGVTRVKVRVL
ncbi:MAG: septal ring lytic transglycosylase RlpA family protein, partial [Saprospiraceae bacterium]|nr:septal ring lytic transglycosylase RlpA family protein [Saprospiraceae bacterium]